MFYQDEPQIILTQTVRDVLTLQNSEPTDREIDSFVNYFLDLEEKAYEKYIKPLEETHGKEWCKAVGYAVFNSLLSEIEKKKRQE